MTERNIPSLDGLRAISITMVILGHLSGTTHFPTVPVLEAYANIGVRVFFVISGFLITSLLLKERARTGTISLSSFYIRRAFRIFPACYAFSIPLIVILWKQLSLKTVLMTVTYLTNYNSTTPRQLAHLWSLAVEEQFYLLWPAVLLLFFRYRKAILVADIIGTPIVNGIMFRSGLGHYVGVWFTSVSDALAVGCLLAIVRAESSKLRKITDSKWFAVIPILALPIPLIPLLHSHRLDVIYIVFGLTAVHIAIALSISHAIDKRYWLLNWYPVSMLGVLSYSLYLWQQPFVTRDSSSAWCAFPLNLALALAFAVASYHLVEKPLLAVRDRLFVNRSGAIADSSVSERDVVAEDGRQTLQDMDH